jgi:tetratricopeptide (TPR) repeat protein
MGDWASTLRTAAQIDTIARTPNALPGFGDKFVHVFLAGSVWPYVARARAEMGDAKGAHALIDQTPRDCYACDRNRADIDAVEGNWGGADFWFAQAVNEAPSIPIAYSDWGRVLLARGKFDDAIAKFAAANQKGPHFADPLEMWGEALMEKNRSDLAVAKFAEAAKYAPNWGRLHLKWAEALWWSGKKDEAKVQFAVAGPLDMSEEDRAALAKFRAGTRL